MTDEPTGIAPESDGLSRRSLIKRGAAVGGALVWTVPVVQTLATPAYATASPPDQPCLVQLAGTASPGQPLPPPTCFGPQDAGCCTCQDTQYAFFVGLGFTPAQSSTLATATCISNRSCTISPALITPCPAP